MKITTLMMALGLALPAITSAQQDRSPAPQDAPPTREHADAPRRHQSERREDEARPAGRDRDMPGGESHRGPRMADEERGERQGPRRGPGPEGRRLPPPLLFGALDANHDGVIDRREMKHAAQALRRLDRNDDGVVTLDEIRPFGPGRDRAMGFRGGRPEDRDGDRHEQGPRGRRGFDRRDRDDDRSNDARPERHAPRGREERPE